MSLVELEVPANGIEGYCAQQVKALEYEEDASAKKESQAIATAANVLKTLFLKSCRFSENGSPVLEFCDVNGKTIGPVSKMRPGDLAGVTADQFSMVGFVDALEEKSIWIACDDISNFDNVNPCVFCVAKLDGLQQYSRMKTVVQDLVLKPNNCGYVSNLLFGTGELSQVPLNPAVLNDDGEVNFCQPLNTDQRAAVAFALRQQHFALIHGPPGTGKTTTLSELIHQLVRGKERVLVCAPSNVAVDSLMSKFRACHRAPCVRLGVRTRISAANQSHTVDAYLQRSQQAEPLTNAKNELQHALLRLVAPNCDYMERRRRQHQVRNLRVEINERQNRLNREALRGVTVCFTTLGSVYKENLIKFFPPNYFTTVVIDECSQGLEAACWMAIQHGKRCILAGDHLQLAPFVLSADAARLGLSTTLMERAMCKLGGRCCQMLTRQYRMHQTIMGWVSQSTYHGRLTADAAVATHLLMHMHGVSYNELTANPLVLWDTSGCGLGEQEYQGSFGNPAEAEMVAYFSHLLASAGVPQAEIGIITPYSRQVTLIGQCLFARGLLGIEVKTVDGFQGREKEAVLLSLVRSSPAGSVGFLADRRRMNVAVSRARRLLCIVTDVNTVRRDPFIKELMKYVMQYGLLKNAHELDTDVTSRAIYDSAPVQQAPTAKSRKKKKRTGESMVDSLTEHKDQLHRICSGSLESLELPKSLSPLNILKLAIEMDKLGLQTTKQGDKVVVTRVTDGSQVATSSEAEDKPLEEDLKVSQLALSSGRTSNKRELEPTEGITTERELEPTEGITTERELVPTEEITTERELVPTEEITTERELVPTEGINTERELVPTEGITTERELVPEKVTTLDCKLESQEGMVMEGELILVEGNSIKEQQKCSETAEGSEMLQSLVKKKKKKRNGKKPALVVEVAFESDVVDRSDEFLDEQVKLVKRCAWPNCKTSVVLIGHNCPFCMSRYCIPHTLPEIHGCTASAKKTAHKDFVHPTPKPLTEAKRKLLKQSLQKKLSEKGQQRQRPDKK